MPIAWTGRTEEVVSPAARTASGASAILDGYGAASTLRAQLNVTTVTGTTPTLDVVVEDTLDGTNWNTIASFIQKTAVGREVVNITAPFTDRLRVRWTIGGVAPSFTFSVTWAAE